MVLLDPDSGVTSAPQFGPAQTCEGKRAVAVPPPAQTGGGSGVGNGQSIGMGCFFWSD